MKDPLIRRFCSCFYALCKFCPPFWWLARHHYIIIWSWPSDGRQCHISSHACEACDSTDFLLLDVEGTKLPFSLGLCALICRRLLRVFHSVFPTCPSLPALKPKPNVSHTTDFCTGFFFSHFCASHFLMWFADGPNPSGALVNLEVVFTTQHLHISVQTKPKEEMNAVVSIQPHEKNNASRGHLQPELHLLVILLR